MATDFTCAVCLGVSEKEILNVAPSSGSLIVCGECGTPWRSFSQFRKNGEIFHFATMAAPLEDGGPWVPPFVADIAFTRSEATVKARLRELGMTLEEFRSVFQEWAEAMDVEPTSARFYGLLLGRSREGE